MSSNYAESLSVFKKLKVYIYEHYATLADPGGYGGGGPRFRLDLILIGGP
jgi:hypothetical protein